MSEEKKPEEELSKIMQRASEKAQRIIDFNDNSKKLAQQIIDLSNAGDNILKYPIPSGINLSTTINAWQRVSDQTDDVLGKLSAIPLYTLSSVASGVNFTMTQFITSDRLYSFLPLQQQSAAITAQKNLGQVIDQSIRKDDITRLMQQFGLVTSPVGKKSAAEQFETAWMAYETPVTQSSPVNTSLIPMRESIETIIQELMRRRPRQEPAKNQKGKIISIGEQLARDGISRSDIESWALQWEKLANELSGSKQANISRDEWRDLLRRAALFLQEILQGLDPTKLRGA
jgi:hypothetical protein